MAKLLILNEMYIKQQRRIRVFFGRNIEMNFQYIEDLIQFIYCLIL